MRYGWFLAVCVFASGAGWAGTTYEVGPGKALTNLGSVPWESLNAGDTVLIHAQQSQTPYREKFVISRAGTSAAPITIRGVPDSGGNLPVISGENATTRLELNFTNEARGLIKIGTASPDVLPQYIVIENLDLKSARPGYSFTNHSGVAAQQYMTNAAAVYIERGQFITIRNCRMRDCGNGLFVGVFNGTTQNILIEGNYIYDNGIEGSTQEHNAYTAAVGITYQFNRFGPLRTNCLGNNLKDRSLGLVVRSNWIESGNRQLDLVDAEDDKSLVTNPLYNSTYVYGNVLIEPSGAGNSQICHYGGDSGDEAIYRKGTLYFYNNTVVSTRTSNTTLLRLSTNSEKADVRNNILYVTETGNKLAILDSTGTAELSNNWVKPGFVNSHGTLAGSVTTLGANVSGIAPGFIDEAGQNYRLTEVAAARNAGTVLNSATLPTNNVTQQYIKHQQVEARLSDGSLDIGAYEFTSQVPPLAPNALIATATSSTQINLAWNDLSQDETGFELERSLDGTTFTQLAVREANTLTHSDLNLTAATQYFYRVRGINAAGASAYSNTANATTKPTKPGGGGSTPDPNDPDGDGLLNEVDTDDDNDGFSDEAELAAGTNPLDLNSKPAAAKVAMTLAKLQAGFRFDTEGKDSISVAGVLPDFPALFDPAGLALVIDVGGAVRAFTIDGKGRGKTADGSAQLVLKPSKKNKQNKKVEFLGGPIAFKASLKKGTWAATWMDEGINPDEDAKNSARTVAVDVTLNGVIYTESVSTQYSAKAQKNGKFKFSRKLPK